MLILVCALHKASGLGEPLIQDTLSSLASSCDNFLSNIHEKSLVYPPTGSALLSWVFPDVKGKLHVEVCRYVSSLVYLLLSRVGFCPGAHMPRTGRCCTAQDCGGGFVPV